MPWVKKCRPSCRHGIWSSEAGSAIASVLVGDVNPSGKLPFTFPASLQDVGAHKLGDYPGTPRNDSNIVDEKYNEGIFVGYRWADKQKTKPLFPFGHGLSYTTLITASNSRQENDHHRRTDYLHPDRQKYGNREGAEVVQLYIATRSHPCSPRKGAERFPKGLPAASGEVKQVSFTIGTDAPSFF